MSANLKGLEEEAEVWVSFSTGKAFWFLTAYEMARIVGSEIVKAFPMFHALTSCDAVSYFSRHGKRTAWAVWTPLPSVDPENDLSNEIDHINEDAYRVVRHPALLKNKHYKECHKLLARKSNVQLIPPTSAVLRQHT